jgi:hypothetical protein
MNKHALPFVLLLLILGSTPALSTVRVSDDLGGQIGEYLEKFKAIRASGERVEINGICASACTLLLGTIPRNRICVTPQAIFEFHGAWDPTPSGGQVVSTAGNHILWSTYPPEIRTWITRHGGLGTQIIYLRGPQLLAMYRSCGRP